MIGIAGKPGKGQRIIRVLLIPAVLILLVWWGMQSDRGQYAAVDPLDPVYHEVVIPSGSTAQDIAVLLGAKELIRSEKAFLRYCRREDLSHRLKAGRYRLSRSQSLPDIAAVIARGDVVRMTLTIPEGYNLDQITGLVVSEGICSLEEWQEALRDSYDFPFMRHIPSRGKSLEGFLFPDTYMITDDTDAAMLVKMMLDNFQKHWDRDFAREAEAAGIDLLEAVIIASLVEKEAQVAAERSKISGVIWNRLEIGQKLQIDASVLYSLGEHREVLYYVDLEVDSPYNTYRYAGLPPGPIASPGGASIEAALKPEKHAYYYYVARGDGSHHFSRTYSEHLQAKRKYIR